MLDFSADLTTSFSRLPMLDRIDAAAAAGFKAVEANDPYSVAADEMARRLKENGLAFVMLALPSTDSATAIAADPDGAAAFRRGLDRAIEYAATIGCRTVTCPSAMTAVDLANAVLRGHLIATLRYAAARLMTQSIRLVIEPLSLHPGEASPQDLPATIAVLDEVGSRNLSMHCSFGYGHGWEPPLINALDRHLRRIGHIRIGNFAEPQAGGHHAMAPERLLVSLDRLGYCGWIGCDGGRNEESLHWLMPFLARQPPVLTWTGEPRRRLERASAAA
jgi:hydroxypyruvate isomerase